MQCIDQIINPSDYELTREELSVLNIIPEWHRTLFLKWPESRYDLFSEYSCDEDHPYFYREIYPTKEASVVHEKLNLIVVKRSIKKILRNDPKATKDFYEYLDLINPYKDVDVISCSQVGCLIFPLLGFSQERSLFEFELRQRFGDGVFCIEELGQYAEENEMFAGIAAAACYIWGKYIKTNQECLLESKVEAERNNDYFINRVFGSNYKDLIKKEGIDTVFSNDASVKPLQQKRGSTGVKYAYYYKVYQQVVAEKETASGKSRLEGSLLDIAAKRAGCGVRTMQKAIQANK